MDSATSQAMRLIGQSAAIQGVRELIRKIGPTNETVLLEGETGTGKDLVAQLIHQASARREQPFVSINCAALPSTLIENELYNGPQYSGHELSKISRLTHTPKWRSEYVHQAYSSYSFQQIVFFLPFFPAV